MRHRFDPSTLRRALVCALTLALTGAFSASLASAWTPTATGVTVSAFGGPGYDNAAEHALDSLGNTYIVGNFTETADFAPGPTVSSLTSAGSTDIYISKLDPSGNLVWVRRIGGTNGDYAYAVTVDKSNNVLITGTTYSQGVDFDPGSGVVTLQSYGTSDAFVLKLSSAGTYSWAKRLGVTGTVTAGNDLVTDATNNVFITGLFIGSVDFDPSSAVAPLTTNGYNDVYVLKLSSAGTYAWAKNVGGPFTDMPASIALAADGGVVTTGSFTGSADFDPSAATATLTSAGATDAFVLKLSTAGAHVWSKSFGGADFDKGNAVVIDPLGFIRVGGYFTHAADFDPSADEVAQQAPGQAGFLLTLTSAGAYSWSRVYAPSDSSQVVGVGNLAVDATGNIVLSGMFVGGVTVTDTLMTRTVSGVSGVFTSRVDSSGTVISLFGFTGPPESNQNPTTGTSFEEGIRFAFDGKGALFAMGMFMGSYDFDLGPGVSMISSVGGTDVFLIKLNADGTPYTTTTTSTTTTTTTLAPTTTTTTPSLLPGAPRSLVGTAGNAQVTLSWLAPNPLPTSPITDYVIQISSNSGSTWSTFIDNVSAATTATVTGLTNGTAYLFRVAAKNDYGTGAYVLSASVRPVAPTTTTLAPTTTTTTPSLLPGAPRSLVAAAGNAQVTLSWLAPNPLPTSPITDYVIQYSSNAGSTWITFVDGISTATTATVAGLTNGTAYLFRVAAKNDYGTGAYVLSASVRPVAPTTTTTTVAPTTTTTTPSLVPRAPTTVRGTTGSGQIAVTWAAPSPLPTSPITDYVIQYTANFGTTWTTFEDGTSTSTSALVTGLTNGTQYRFRVAAVNAYGTSPWSYPSSGVWALAPATTTIPTTTTTTLAPAVPRPPTTLRVVAGTAQATLSWVPPSPLPVSPITDYVIQYSSNYGTTWTTFPDASSTSTSVTVTGLTSSVQYRFRVAAVNSVGTSLWSTASTGVWVL